MLEVLRFKLMWVKWIILYKELEQVVSYLKSSKTGYIPHSISAYTPDVLKI